MKFLVLLYVPSILIGFSRSQEELFDLDNNLFEDDSLDLIIPLDNLSWEESYRWNPTDEADPSILLAENSDCDLGFNEIDPFGKTRRASSCTPSTAPPPTGQTNPSNQPNDNDNDPQFDFIPFSSNRIVPFVFHEDLEVCSSRIFGLSITPVCDSPGRTRVVEIPGRNSVDLYDVYPRTSISFRWIWQQLLNKCRYRGTNRMPRSQIQIMVLPRYCIRGMFMFTPLNRHT